MNKYQTPTNEIIEGATVAGAILKLRETNNQLDGYFDSCYDWTLHPDGIHLIARPKKYQALDSRIADPKRQQDHIEAMGKIGQAEIDKDENQVVNSN